MNKGFRHGARRAGGLGLCAALLVAAACEEPTLPTELDEIRYSTVTIDESTLRPEPGASLTRGQTVTYDVDVLYQRSAEDVAAAGDVLLGFYIEMWDSVPDVGWNWLGDAVDSVVTVSGSEGSLSFTGSFTVPPMAPRCETFDVIRLLAIMDPAANTAYRDTETYPLSGTATIPSAGTMSFGESRSGSLDAGVSCESWTLTLDAAQTVALALSSETLDTYLILQTSTGVEIARDDDSGGNLNSLIVQDLQAGTYRVLVSTYGGGEGDYVLSATGASNACTLAGTLTPGGVGSGTLGLGDCQFGDGSFYDFWTLSLASDDSIAIDMSSAEFDTYLLLADGSGSVVAENDDFGTTTDSRIEVRLGAGTYTIYANSFEAGMTGSYALSVASLGGGGGGVSTIGSARTQADGTPVTVQGVVTAGTGVYAAQTFYLQDATAGIAVFLGAGSSPGPFAEGDSVEVSGTIGAFNSEVQIEGAVDVTVLGTTSVPAPRPATVDEANAGQWQGELVQVADLVVDSVGTASAAGDFTVYTTHTSGTGGTLQIFVDATTGITTGAFTPGATYDVTGVMSVFGSVHQLKPRRLSDIQQVSAADPCTTWQPVSIGESPTGTLETGDCTDVNGYIYDVYELTITSTTSVTITLRSTAFDAYLFLTDAAGSVLTEDDDSGGGTNGTDSQISYSLAPGTYGIWASTFTAGETGAYQLSVQ